ncbi:MAG: hypothetical protein IK012_11265 [Fibrobacter sp.]|uniref:hypothetical protein n=1 Tax=Fibrobacter sp. TaxID=35828 RepID=UPI0025C568F9|nr:hypothetical protein [Fibrobacter sp.]MBR4785810.1 hypothetical protein [Fibrobacter sp.]
MKRSFILAGCAALALTLGACGDTNSSDASDDLLSSAGNSEKSSSSKAEESSSSMKREIPEGARVATLDDLERNMELSGFFGGKAYLATGTKLGLFSIWVPDTAWIAAPSDFKDGVIDFSQASIAAIDAKGVVDSMKALVAKNSGRSIGFIVNDEDQLQYTLDGKTYKDVKEASVKTSSSIISKGEDLAGKKLECKQDSSAKEIYSFYDGRYIVENKGEKDNTWSAGYYDIHRGKLLLRPIFFTAALPSLFTASVSSEYGIEFSTGKSLSCKTSDLEYEKISAKDLAQEWDVSVDGLDWMLDLKKDKTFELEAYKGVEGKELKKGTWDVYGDNLMLKVTGCLNTDCTTSVKGVVSDLDPKKGFKYAHGDTDKPNIPKEWEVPMYE